MQITDLGGHSGCRILLCEAEDNNVFVRKISSSVEYNKRLLVQAEKQKNYKNKTIKTPKVYEIGYNEEGLLYFDMEYIQGITLAEYMKTIEIGKVRVVVESIVSNIVDLSPNSINADESIFVKKINSLESILFDKKNTIIYEAIDILKKHSWKNFTNTSCHGDLTLENIIVKDNQLYLIDFLDSFYDCWIMDIGTLLQDVQTLWSYRTQQEMNINTILRLIIFRDILIDTVKEKVGENYIEVYYALLLKLIRIYPYVKDELTYNFLNEKTKSIIKLIEEAKK